MERLFCGGRHKVKPASLQNRLGNCESPQDCPRRVPDVLHLSHKKMNSGRNTPPPWDTPQGRACFERWIAYAMAKLNAYKGGEQFNARKPWSINQYGILAGNPRF